jgi:dienelactone hydrolase
MSEDRRQRRSRLRRRRRVRRLLRLAIGALLVLAGLVALDLANGGGPARDRKERTTADARTSPTTTRRASAARFATVGVRTVPLYDLTRRRELRTLLLYPALASRRVTTERDAPAAPGPFPLIVFGHGFAVTPAPYRPLLDRWVRAGFVVAAPIFPRSNEGAPGGPYEPDLPNQPADMVYVIAALRKMSAPGGAFAGLIGSSVAVSGQSDGGDTALAAALDPRSHAIRIDAAVILSGAEDPFARRFEPLAGTPLLATQGTADTVNLPSETLAYFTAAARPKYLLLLDGAEHQAPYTQPGPQLDAVTRTTVAFLDRYLKNEPGPLRALGRAGNAGGATELQSYP